MIVRKAEEKDLLNIQKLIAKAGLREEGIVENLDRFLVVLNEENEMIGTVGLEKYEQDGLLRSLVLDSPIWTARLSLEFLEVALNYAKEQQIKTVYLCSKGTNALFHQLGFRHINLTAVPETIKQSSHFKKNQKVEMNVWAKST